MRFVRLALLVCTFAFAAAGCSQATANATGVRVSVMPGTVNAGSQIQIQANCGDNTNPATITSPAFGNVTVNPSAGGTLSATATVPASTPKGTYDVRLACPTGSRATTKLTVLNSMGQQTGQSQTNAPGPNTGGGFFANGGSSSGMRALFSDPANRGPLIWLSAGVACLIAAALLAVKPRRTRVRPARAAALDPDTFHRGSSRASADPETALVRPVDPWSDKDPSAGRH